MTGRFPGLHCPVAPQMRQWLALVTSRAEQVGRTGLTTTNAQLSVGMPHATSSCEQLFRGHDTQVRRLRTRSKQRFLQQEMRNGQWRAARQQYFGANGYLVPWGPRHGSHDAIVASGRGVLEQTNTDKRCNMIYLASLRHKVRLRYKPNTEVAWNCGDM